LNSLRLSIAQLTLPSR